MITALVLILQLYNIESYLIAVVDLDQLRLLSSCDSVKSMAAVKVADQGGGADRLRNSADQSGSCDDLLLLLLLLDEDLLLVDVVAASVDDGDGVVVVVVDDDGRGG